MADAEDPGRRGALRALIKVGSVAFGCALAAPAAVFVVGPLRSRAGAAARWVRTVTFASLREGEPRKVAIVADERDAWTLTKNVELGAAWLIRRGDRVIAFSAMCPHLGCSVGAEASGAFSCPCHASAFDADGKRGMGPSPRDLDTLGTKIEEGFVLVDFRTYRTGRPEKVEAG
jgi:menaquinol-cytochrome c reductase iron-sulfur subunit